MSLYFILLLIVFIQSAFLLVGRKAGKFLFLLFTFGECFVIEGFRSFNVGSDTKAYLDIYSYISQIDFSNLFSMSSYLEKGYMLLNKIISVVFYDPQWLFIITAVFICFSTARFIFKHSPNVLLSAILYLTLDMFFFNLTGIRQSLAIAILFFAYDFLLSRRFIIFALIVLAASAFHSSAIIFIAVYPLYNIRIDAKKAFVIFVLGLVCFISFVEFSKIIFSLFPKYSDYAMTSLFGGEMKSASIIKTVLGFAVFIFSFSVFRILPKSEEDNTRQFNILLWFALLWTVFQFVSVNAIILERVSLYFYAFSMVLLPLAISHIRKASARGFVAVAVCAFAITYAGVILYYRPDWYSVIPYSFCWQVM